MGEDRSLEPSGHFAFRRPSDDARLAALSPRKHAVQARSRETVEVILEAAAQVFAREGFAAATTERIAERAGVSVGSIYQYWPNKNAIAIALMERHGEDSLARVLPELERLGDTEIPLPVRVEAVVRALAELHHESADLHWTLDTEATVPVPYRERIAELTSRLADALPDALGIAPDAALIVACALEALPHALLRPATRMETEASVRELTRLLVGYLSASGAR